MKIILCSIIFLLLHVSANATPFMNMIVMGGGSAGAAYSCATDACATCTQQERFECGSETIGGDADNEIAAASWVAFTGDANFTGTVLQGDESCELGTGTESAALNTTGYDTDHYFAWMFNIVSGGTDENITHLYFYNTGTTVADFILRWDSVASDYYIRLRHSGTGTSSDSTKHFDIGSTYYVKVKYNNGSGANGVWQIWWSTDGSSWTLDNDISNATDQLQINKVKWASSTNKSVLIDELRLDDADIDY